VLRLRQAHGANREVVRRATVVLLAHQGKTSAEIEKACGLSRVSVWRLLCVLAKRGAEAALLTKRKPGRPSRRLAVLALARAGKANRVIARHLQITAATVRAHRRTAQK
jgi:DNA-binding CsgD family transcriptional regulator